MRIVLRSTGSRSSTPMTWRAATASITPVSCGIADRRAPLPRMSRWDATPKPAQGECGCSRRRTAATWRSADARPLHPRYRPPAAAIGRCWSAATAVLLTAVLLPGGLAASWPAFPAEPARTMALSAGTSRSMEATRPERRPRLARRPCSAEAKPLRLREG